MALLTPQLNDYDLVEEGQLEPLDRLVRDDETYSDVGDDGFRCYWDVETGKCLFSVTTILGAVSGPTPRLERWYANDPEHAEWWKHYTSVRGSIIHEMLLNPLAERELPEEASLSELDPSDRANCREDIEKAKTIWAKLMQQEDFGDIVGVEIRVWDEELGYAGTFDLLCYLDGKLTLCDLKTSKELYDKHIVQTSAYVHAVEKMYGFDIEQRCVIRLCPDQQHNPFLEPEIHRLPDVTDEWEKKCEMFSSVVPERETDVVPKRVKNEY